MYQSGSSWENKSHCKYFKNLIQGIGYTGGVTEKPHRQCNSDLEISQSRKSLPLPVPNLGLQGCLREMGPWSKEEMQLPRRRE